MKLVTQVQILDEAVCISLHANTLGKSSPIDWACRIHQLHLCRGIRLSTNKCPGYYSKQSDQSGDCRVAIAPRSTLT